MPKQRSVTLTKRYKELSLANDQQFLNKNLKHYLLTVPICYEVLINVSYDPPLRKDHGSHRKSAN